MASEKIYLIGSEEELTPMTEELYENEDVLQVLLEKYPDLLAGEQMNKAAARRWVLVERHMGVPDKEGGSNRWSMDHLFLDQDGIPTVVEVKRSTDTRIRREVVGQMLDYAANAVVYWPVERIRASFEKTCEKGGSDSDDVLVNLLHLEEIDEESDGISIDKFWDDVDTYLKAGKIRMVFVADVIPDELLRIVEFLNEQMDPAEVLAVELKQFVGEKVKTLVPRVLGQTAEARQKKGGSARERKRWDEQSFFGEAKNRLNEDEAEQLKKLYDFSKTIGTINWSIQRQNYNYLQVKSPKISEKQALYTLLMDGKLRLHFGNNDENLTYVHFRDGLKKRFEELELDQFAKDWGRVNTNIPASSWISLTDKIIAILKELIDEA